jgi:hypothetical protein
MANVVHSSPTTATMAPVGDGVSFMSKTNLNKIPFI